MNFGHLGEVGGYCPPLPPPPWLPLTMPMWSTDGRQFSSLTVGWLSHRVGVSGGTRFRRVRRKKKKRRRRKERRRRRWSRRLDRRCWLHSARTLKLVECRRGQHVSRQSSYHSTQWLLSTQTCGLVHTLLQLESKLLLLLLLRVCDIPVNFILSANTAEKLWTYTTMATNHDGHNHMTATLPQAHSN